MDNAVDEALAGFCDQIQVIINRDGSVTVDDNGRGIPVDIMPPQYGKSALEIVLTVLHAGGKFDKNTYQVSGGLHGVGVSVVNALSSWLDATVFRDGSVYTMQFRQGLVAKPITSRPEAEHEMAVRHEERYGSRPPTGQRLDYERLQGTRITFQPDRSIFETVEFDYDVLDHRLRELAYLNSGLTISSGMNAPGTRSRTVSTTVSESSSPISVRGKRASTTTSSTSRSATPPRAWSRSRLPCSTTTHT